MVCRVALLLSVIVAAATILSAIAAPVDRDVQPLPEYEDPEYALAMLNRLLHTNALENLLQPSAHGRKRGLDLGLGRGFSGSQAAKHLMGLSAATFAGGPGRRKREASGHGVGSGSENLLTHPRQYIAAEDDSNSELALHRR